MKNLIETIDVYGKKVIVDFANAKLMNFSNKENKKTYNVSIYENNEKTMFFTDVEVEGRVEAIDEKLSQWNNRLTYMYACEIDFNAAKNDKDGEIWKKYVDYAKTNQTRFFDENGDWRKDFIIDPIELV